MSSPPVLGLDVGYRRSRLSGGARLVTAPMRERGSVAIAFNFGVGSRFEDERRSGLSHFVEHMVFKGAGRFPTAQAISEEIEGVGGILNADTDREATVFWSVVPAGRLRRAIAVLSDMARRPVVDRKEVGRERLVVLEELRSSADSPQDHVHTVFDEVMWPDHALGRDIAGNEETVMRFDREECLAHLALHYRNENLVVSIAGAVDHDEALEVLEGELGAQSAGPAIPMPAAAEPAPTEGNIRFHYKETEQAHILVGARSVAQEDPDRFAVDVLNGLLGDGMSSRLFSELRERQALAYDVHSFTIRLSDSGALAMYIGCDPSRAVEAVGAGVHELQRLASEPISGAELERAVEYLKGRLVLGLETSAAMSSYLGQQELATGSIMTPDQVIERVEAVTSGDVQRVASATLQGGLRAAVVGPFRNLNGLGAALKGETGGG